METAVSSGLPYRLHRLELVRTQPDREWIKAVGGCAEVRQIRDNRGSDPTRVAAEPLDIIMEACNSMLLENRVALITGGTNGIGRASAERFAEEGAKVVICGRNDERGQDVVRTIEENGGEALYLRIDVGQMSGIKNLIDATYDRFGKLDVIFSNAGIYGMKGSAVDITEEDFDRVLSVNLKAAWMLAHNAFPRMLGDGGGVMIICGSPHSKRGYANYCAYQTTKGGLAALTRSLGADFAPDIRVNCLIPGAFITGLWDDVPRETIDMSAKFCIMQRNGELREIADAALFLASDMSSFMTGADLVVDGGLINIINKYKKKE